MAREGNSNGTRWWGMARAWPEDRAEDGGPVCKSGQPKVDLPVKAARPAQCWIYGFWPASIKQSITAFYLCDSSGESTDNNREVEKH
ncbi:MAG: hypothetical protein FRX49_05964 [Trebouxia sp. A1-2]|nr:MAG: hypothetical protein FRX49_05964 [Trebouxia sp. A1-2]